jgi:hypothetical protein
LQNATGHVVQVAAARVGVHVDTNVNDAVQGHAALRVSDACERAQCCESEKRLFHRMISKEYESFVQGEYLSNVDALLISTSREVAT